ncbi:C6 zinc finger domain-containing protein [Lasiodiplodia theobromae]|uniref:C6 zinc finger domain-containing protein n=1 Tax=Lasiodiplodia theobromae TaxID=45133 RepID=UPI0015C35FE5|nr:C6 zinc finger domain-containing protein [Lasiodiplodia theobromae]KAF4544209.1 C6 zinc finger domain-containing protein [Lasiodiplodia theobromae]
MSNTSSVDSERIARLEQLVLNLQAEIDTISKHNASHSINTSHSATPAPPTPPPPTTSPPESIEDIRLFHHFCVSTSKTLATEPSRHKLWSEFVPQLACTHPFLMRGLLAVSALHLSHLHPHQHAHYTHLSTHHQTLSLTLFTAALPPTTTTLTPTTSPAFLLLSSLVFLLNTYPLAHPHNNTPITLPSITQSLSLLRGTISLLLLSPDVWQHARSGPLKDLFAHIEPVAHPRGPFVDKLDALVDALRRELVGTPAKAKKRVALLAAVEALRHTYALLVAARVGDRRDRLWTWAVVIPEEVLALLEEECAVALVVLAYFCVLVGSVECGVDWGEEQWFMKGWSGGVVECVVEVLERKEEEEGMWREWVEWPVSCVRKGLNVLETAGDST